MRPLVEATLDALGGLTIIEAEAVLDTARRILWVHAFSGHPFDAVAAEIGASPLAAQLGGLLRAELASHLGADRPGGEGWRMVEGFALVDALLSETRLTLYVATYQNDPRSRFGQFAKSWMEEAGRYASAPRETATGLH